MRSTPRPCCNCQWRRRSSAPVARSCARETLPLQYPSVARFNSRAAPRGGKPRFEAIVIEGRNLTSNDRGGGGDPAVISGFLRGGEGPGGGAEAEGGPVVARGPPARPRRPPDPRRSGLEWPPG